MTVEPRYVFDGWVYEPGRRRLLDPDGKEVDLTSSETDVVQAFCQNPRKALTREFLVSAIWHRPGTAIGDRSVDVLITRLRRKIERNPKHPQIIKTVRHDGYWFTPASVLMNGDQEVQSRL
jgi:two-component system OmpR family response regulator